jgi:tight adherence protein B
MGLELAAAILAFVSVTAVVGAVMARSPEARAVERRLSSMSVPLSPKPQVQGGDLLLRGRHSGVPAIRRLLERSEWSQRAWTDLQQAGLPLKVGEYLALRLLLATLAVLMALFLGPGGLLGVVLIVAAGAIGFFLPALYLRFKKARRQRQIGQQMVEMLQLISNALRSGFAFTQAVEMAAKQLTPPLQDELQHFLRDTNMGARLDDALKGLVERTGSVDMEMLVTTIMIQRLTGGNLSEVLDNVGETIRERQRLYGEIAALTAQQRLTGFILSIYPLVLGAIFFALAPSIWKVMFTEDIGRIVLVGALVLQTMGALWIRQILNLDV